MRPRPDETRKNYTALCFAFHARMDFTITNDDGEWAFLSSSLSGRHLSLFIHFSIVREEGKLTSCLFLFKAGVMNKSNQEMPWRSIKSSKPPRRLRVEGKDLITWSRSWGRNFDWDMINVLRERGEGGHTRQEAGKGRKVEKGRDGSLITITCCCCYYYYYSFTGRYIYTRLCIANLSRH